MGLGWKVKNSMRIGGNLSVGGSTTFGISQGFADSILFTLGTDNDIAMVNRATTLNAATSLTGVLVGTPASAATPANSLLISNVTADGDIAFFTRNAAGANSIEMVRLDASAGLVVINEAAADVDFRVEGDTNTSMLVIDGGTDSMALGRAVVAGAALSIGNLTGRTLVTAVGNQLHLPAGSLTDGGATGTIAVLAPVVLGIQTVLATNTITYSDAATLYIAGVPVASTGATFTRAYSMLVKGVSRFDADVALGFAGVATGTLTFNGTTSGSCTLTVPDVAGTAFTLKLPTSVGSNGQQLTTDGATPGILSWAAAGSMKQFKNILGRIDPMEALAKIAGAEVSRFTYKPDGEITTGDFDTVYTGVMADDMPEVMHHNGKIFAPVSAFGYAVAAIQALLAKVDRLEAQAAARA